MYACVIVWTRSMSSKTVISSLDFVVNRFFMKLFKTSDINIVKQCQREFNFSIPSDILVRRGEKFVNRYRQCDNIFCKYM